MVQSAAYSDEQLPQRVAAIEAHLQHLATKEDLQKLKVWMLSGVIGGMGLAAAIATAIARWWA